MSALTALTLAVMAYILVVVSAILFDGWLAMAFIIPLSIVIVFLIVLFYILYEDY